MEVTVCTLTRDRTAHLVNQVRGLLRSSTPPAAHVVAVMGGEDPSGDVPATPWPTRYVEVPSQGPLPLATARNEAVRAAGTEGIVLLDVDCIPGRHLIGAYAHGLQRLDAILMGGVRYLPSDAASGGVPDDDDLHRLGARHPVRPDPPPPGELQTTDAYELFWSLSFAVRRGTMLERIGGFDEGYGGYGAEDTDLAFRAREAGVPLAWVGAAWAYHQHHDTYDPPVQHVRSIVVNARRFREVWGRWAMEGWLARFDELGLVEWDPDSDRLEFVRDPSASELEEAHRPAAVPSGS